MKITPNMYDIKYILMYKKHEQVKIDQIRENMSNEIDNNLNFIRRHRYI